MAQPTTTFTNLAGSMWVGTAPPTTAQMGRAVTNGDFYFDTELNMFGVYYSGSWYYTLALTAAAATTTSTTTTTSTSTTAS